MVDSSVEMYRLLQELSTQKYNKELINRTRKYIPAYPVNCY